MAVHNMNACLRIDFLHRIIHSPIVFLRRNFVISDREPTHLVLGNPLFVSNKDCEWICCLIDKFLLGAHILVRIAQTAYFIIIRLDIGLIPINVSIFFLLWKSLPHTLS